jgi:hypothetical protein
MRRQREKGKFINQFALLDHTRLMRKSSVENNIVIKCKYEKIDERKENILPQFFSSFCDELSSKQI